MICLIDVVSQFRQFVCMLQCHTINKFRKLVTLGKSVFILLRDFFDDTLLQLNHSLVFYRATLC